MVFICLIQDIRMVAQKPSSSSKSLGSIQKTGVSSQHNSMMGSYCRSPEIWNYDTGAVVMGPNSTLMYKLHPAPERVVSCEQDGCWNRKNYRNYLRHFQIAQRTELSSRRYRLFLSQHDGMTIGGRIYMIWLISRGKRRTPSRSLPRYSCKSLM